MSGGSNEKFMELKKSYEILQEYMDSYSFLLKKVSLKTVSSIYKLQELG